MFRDTETYVAPLTKAVTMRRGNWGNWGKEALYGPGRREGSSRRGLVLGDYEPPTRAWAGVGAKMATIEIARGLRRVRGF
jgi:hypothetical protein